MFLAIALLLLLAWIAGFVVFHVTAFFIHILLILAVIAIIVHYIRGRSVATFANQNKIADAQEASAIFSPHFYL